MYHALFEAFKNYIEACEKTNSFLLDSSSHGKVADLKHSDFVKEFEKTRQFEELIKELSAHEKIRKLGWEWQPKKPFEGGYIVL